MAKHLQVTFGHSPNHGWIVSSEVLGTGMTDFIKCGSRDEAERLHDALKAAYNLGKNHVRQELRDVMKET